MAVESGNSLLGNEITRSVSEKAKPASFIYFLLFLTLGGTTKLWMDYRMLSLGLGLLFLLVGFARYRSCLAIRSADNDRLSSLRWWFYALTLTLSLGWGGLSAFTVLTYGASKTTLMVLFPTAGSAAGAIVTLAPAKRLLRAHLLALCLPGILAFSVSSGSDSLSYVLQSLIFLSFLLQQAGALSRTLSRDLENNRLIANQKRELEFARDQALAAARVKSEFTATVSHELRTPLNGILGMTELLLDRNLDAESRQVGETIRDCGHTLLAIVNDILDFSKLESGKMVIENLPFSIEECVSSVLLVFSETVRKKSLTLHSSIDSSVPKFVEGDLGRLRQILVNLVGNAVKFTSRGSVFLEVRAEKRHDGMHRITFAVKDTGIGIPPEAMQRLFQAYSQIDARTARKFGGTGLGLAICKRIVEWMGGSLWVDSEPGRGSTFYVSLNLLEAEGKPKGNKDRAYEALFAEHSPSRFHVLVAEDNPVNQKLTLAMLTKAGYRVHAVSNGEEVIREVSREKYDLVLMDCQMPEMDGYETTRRLRATPEYSGLRIVALTANAMEGDRERCLSAGMDDYLAKPIVYGELMAVLRRWLQKGSDAEKDLDFKRTA